LSAISNRALGTPLPIGNSGKSAHRTGWRNAKHAAQWRATVKTYAEPVIGSLPVQNIEPAYVAAVEEARAEVDAGKTIPYEEVRRWLLSWGTDNELPRARCK